jgi:hypothetical protein
VPGVTEVLNLLRSRGKRVTKDSAAADCLRAIGKNVLFVTNGASSSREKFKKAFDGFGIQASVVSFAPGLVKWADNPSLSVHVERDLRLCLCVCDLPL